MTRLEQLESRLTTLEEEIKALKSKLKAHEWQLLPQAAINLNCSEETLRRRIREAKKTPNKCQFKKGIHWRENNHRYEINVSRWSSR